MYKQTCAVLQTEQFEFYEVKNDVESKQTVFSSKRTTKISLFAKMHILVTLFFQYLNVIISCKSRMLNILPWMTIRNNAFAGEIIQLLAYEGLLLAKMNCSPVRIQRLLKFKKNNCLSAL